MIDNVYHVSRGRSGASSRKTLDPALRALLDHVAAELAREYIRLMEAAASSEAAAAMSATDP